MSLPARTCRAQVSAFASQYRATSARFIAVTPSTNRRLSSVSLGVLAPRAQAPNALNCARRSGRQRWKQRPHHMGRDFLEHAHRARDVSIAGVNHPQVKGAEMPFGHNLDELTVAH